MLQEMRRTSICPKLASVMVAPAEGEGNWIVQTFDPGPHRPEDCNRAFALILPDLKTRSARAGVIVQPRELTPSAAAPVTFCAAGW